MRAVLAALALLVAQPFDEARGPDFAYGPFDETSKFGRQGVAYYATGHTDRIGPGVWNVRGVALPEERWWKCDGVGDGAGTCSLASTTTATLSGGIPEINTPFCNAAGTCLIAGTFDGANDWYTLPSASLFNIGTGDATFLVLFRASLNAASTDRMIGTRDGVTPVSGYDITWASSGVTSYVSRGGVYVSSVTPAGSAPPQDWSLAYLTVDNDGQAQMCGPAGTCGSAAGVPGSGALTNDQPARVGNHATLARLWDGELVAILKWNHVFTSAERTAVKRAIDGLAVDVGAGDIALTRTTQTWAELPDASGQYQAFAPGMSAQTPAGQSMGATRTSYGYNSCDASAWSESGGDGCAVTTNTESGPFASTFGGPEADTLTDNNAGSECRYISMVDATGGGKTFSVFAKQGSSPYFRLYVREDGTFIGTCNVMATASFARYSCTATASGTQAAVSGWVCPGVDAPAQTSIIVTGAQLEKSVEATAPCIAGGTFSTCSNDAYAADTTNWPTAAGCISMDYTPATATPTSAAYFWDSSNRGTATGVLFIRANTNFMSGAIYAPPATNCASVESAVLSWTPGTKYRVKVCWSATKLQLFRNGVVVATDDTVSCVPTAHTTARIGYAGVTENGRGAWDDFLAERQ